MQKQSQIQSVNLQVPRLTKQNLRAVLVKEDGYRQGGVRFQHEIVQGKHIFHNYGHGRAQASTAYATSFLVVQSLEMKAGAGQILEAGVIGCGLTGLLTALELRKKGFACTIYADKFPVRGQKDSKKLLRCQVDPGLWLPFGVSQQDKLNFQIMTKQTFEFYKDCIETNRYQSLKVIDIYQRDKTVKQLKSKIMPFIQNTYKDVHVNMGGITEQYITFRTIKIDMELFIQELKTQCLIRGVKLVNKKFNTKQDVLSLRQKVIYNCSGMSSKYLFNDSNLKSFPAHILCFKNQSPMNYSLSAIHNGVQLNLHCSKDNIILGPFSIEKSQLYSGSSDQKNIEDMLRSAQSFLEQRSNLRPNL